MRYRYFLAMFAGAACMAAAQATPPVSVHDAWVRGTVPQQRATGAFMRLAASAPVRLVAAASPAAARVEIHEMRIVDDVMRMRQIAGIDLAGGTSLELKPGGYHIMLLDLAQQARAGERIPLSLTFEHPGGARFSVDVSATVRALGAPQEDHR